MTALTIAIGVDVGQQVDPTAVAVAEVTAQVHADRAEDRYVIRHLERLPLGTPYPDVATRVTAIVETLRARTPHVALYLDATGVGRPLMDLLTQGGTALHAFYFIAGGKRTVRPDGSIALGKGWMVSRLQTLVQTGRLSLPQTAEARALAAELLTYEIRVSRTGRDTFGAFAHGTHDDLVTAVGLSVL